MNLWAVEGSSVWGFPLLAAERHQRIDSAFLEIFRQCMTAHFAEVSFLLAGKFARVLEHRRRHPEIGVEPHLAATLQGAGHPDVVVIFVGRHWGLDRRAHPKMDRFLSHCTQLISLA